MIEQNLLLEIIHLVLAIIKRLAMFIFYTKSKLAGNILVQNSKGRWVLLKLS